MSTIRNTYYLRATGSVGKCMNLSVGNVKKLVKDTYGVGSVILCIPYITSALIAEWKSVLVQTTPDANACGRGRRVHQLFLRQLLGQLQFS